MEWFVFSRLVLPNYPYNNKRNELVNIFFFFKSSITAIDVYKYMFLNKLYGYKY